MPIRSLVCAAVLFAASAARICVAADFDSAPEASASHDLFTSWFGTKAAPMEPAAEGEGHEHAVTSRTGELVVNALGLLGISYRFGGDSPTAGFDCSGMVRYVFQNAIGLSLPHRAEEISRVGTKISREDLKPGDLVFYRTLRRAFSHVGIYLGNNRFIHAPSAGGAVRVDNMGESYWTARFNGARRIDP